MRRATACGLLGVLALVVQGGLARWIAPPWCPDLGLLVVVSLGLCWERPASGLTLAAALGFAADLLSGSLLGQLALLRLMAFAASRLASRQLNLRGALPLAVFTVALSGADALLTLLLTGFFGGATALTAAWLGGVLIHAVVNGLLSPLVYVGVQAVWAFSGEDEAGRRTLRLEAREGSA